MNNDITRASGDGSSPFDAIRRVTPEGREYWSARELQPLLGYAVWRDFANAIERARIAAANSGHDVTSNFAGARKITETKPAEDFHLSRFACYLIALNGDPRKPEIAAAQTYFVIRTREAEVGSASNVVSLPDRRALAQMVIEAEDRADREAAARLEAEAHALELEAPASAWKHMASSHGDYMVRDAAKVLSRDPNIDIGQQRLFKFMQAEGWIFRERGAWKPYQSQVDNGRLVQKLNRPYLNERTGLMEVPAPSIRITPKGMAELHRRLGGGPGGIAALAVTA